MIDETIQSGDYSLQPTEDGGYFFHGPCVHFNFSRVTKNGDEFGWHLWSHFRVPLHVDENVPDEIGAALDDLCMET